MKVRTAGTAGTIDVRSHASGFGDPPVKPVKLSAGTLNGGSHGPIPYTRRTIDWGAAPAEARADQLDLKATNLSAVTIDPQRAGVGCDARINVTSDGPITVTLGGCGVSARASAGSSIVG